MSFSPITGSAATTLNTSTEGLRHGQIAMPTFDGVIPAYFAAPANAKHPALILVVQEIFGLHEHIRDICRRFAKQGYMAVAVELYQRQGDAGSYTDMSALIKNIVSKVSDEQVMADLDASVQWAATEGADTSRVGVTGFCWGGRITWMYAAHNPQCKAGVAWYGKLATGHGPLQVSNPIDVADSLHAPVLGLYGGQDASIPQADVQRMQAALKHGSAPAQASQIVVYPESGHAFYADYRPSYRQADAYDAWGKALSWFGKHLA